MGILCVGGGLATLGWEIAAWQRRDFGALSYPDSLRVVIPAVTSITPSTVADEPWGRP